MYKVVLTSQNSLLSESSYQNHPEAREALLTIAASLTRESVLAIEEAAGMGWRTIIESPLEIERLGYEVSKTANTVNVQLGLARYAVTCYTVDTVAWEDVGFWRAAEKADQLRQRLEVAQ